MTEILKTRVFVTFIVQFRRYKRIKLSKLFTDTNKRTKFKYVRTDT